MKGKKIYPFLIVAILVMSFIVTYDINEKTDRNFAFADTLNELSPAIAASDEPISEIKYDIIICDVEHGTKVVKNENQFEGYEKVIQNGFDGIKRCVYEETYVNGEAVSKILAEEIVRKEPVDKIVEIGTKKHLVTSRGGFRYSNELALIATAYDLSYESTGKYPGESGYGITASGTKAQPGTAAVDPRVIPLGTKLYIASIDGSPDYGFATAEDTGGAIKGNKIDLFMENGSDCDNFGRRQVKVYILD